MIDAYHVSMVFYDFFELPLPLLLFPIFHLFSQSCKRLFSIFIPDEIFRCLTQACQRIVIIQFCFSCLYVLMRRREICARALEHFRGGALLQIGQRFDQVLGISTQRPGTRRRSTWAR